MEIQYVGVNDITPEEWFILHHDMDRRVMNNTPDSTFAVARIAGKLGLKINKELPQAEKVEISSIFCNSNSLITDKKQLIG